MKTLLASLIALVTLAWGWDVLVAGSAAGGSAAVGHPPGRAFT